MAKLRAISLNNNRFAVKSKQLNFCYKKFWGRYLSYVISPSRNRENEVTGGLSVSTQL